MQSKKNFAFYWCKKNVIKRTVPLLQMVSEISNKKKNLKKTIPLLQMVSQIK